MANESGVADHQRTTRLGCEGKSWVWDHARGMNKSVSLIGPERFKLVSDGSGIHVSCTMQTLQEAEAVREIIRSIAYASLPATRPMVHGDIHWTEPPPPETYAEKVARVFGPCEPASGQAERVHAILPRQRGGLARA